VGANAVLLAAFARDLGNEDLDGKTVAAKLYHTLDADRQEAGIVDIWCYGFSVEMEFGNGEHWAVECLGPNAFRLYPGVVREESVTWLSLWVAPDYTLEELIERMNDVAAAARVQKDHAPDASKD
jgi:hypothetical protein